jgi:hypothetical protein
MANESNPYNQFLIFNYRKILLAMIKGDNNGEEPQESVDPIDKRQLLKIFFKKSMTFFPCNQGQLWIQL